MNQKQTEELKHYLSVLHEARQKYDTLQDELKRRKAAYDDANRDLMKQIQEAGEWMEQSDLAVRAIAEDLYGETNEKTLGFGVVVKEYPQISYDPNEAMKWAEKEMSVAIKRSLDKKMFEDYAKKNELPFVSMSKIYKATIPSKIALV